MLTFRRPLVAFAVMLIVALAAACTSEASPSAPPAPSVAPAAATTTETAATNGLTATPLSGTATAAPPTAQQAQPTKVTLPSLNTVELVKLLRPSVVHIQTEVAAGMDVFTGRVIPQTGVGTGSIVDGQGHIITNNHVVEGARRITVALDDGRTFTARLIGGDAFTDLAVIKIDASNLKPATLGDSDALQVGEDLVAIGFALDLEGGPSVTKGVVSAVDRTVGDLDGLIQTDTDISSGNSGGPLVNSRGEVIGVNTLTISGSGGVTMGGQSAQGLNFAISINEAKTIMRSLIERGRVVRSFLGVRLATVTPAIARNNILPVERGAIIMTVDPNTPAGRAGIQANDIIVAMDGQAIRSAASLLRFLTANPPGKKVSVELFRGSAKRTVEVTLGERPAS